MINLTADCASDKTLRCRGDEGLLQRRVPAVLKGPNVGLHIICSTDSWSLAATSEGMDCVQKELHEDNGVAEPFLVLSSKCLSRLTTFHYFQSLCWC